MIDGKFYERMQRLVQLMGQFPHRSMRALQQEAMHLYPIQSLELQRYWLSSKIAAKAADWANRELYAEQDRLEQERIQTMFDERG